VADDDFMEMGSTGWVSIAGGLYYNIHTKEVMDEEGNIISEDGSELLFGDPLEGN
jgi:hypothetical protein